MPQKITLQDVEELRHLTPKRCRFLDYAIVNPKSDETYVVSTKFRSLDRMFEAETGIATKSGPHGPYVFLSDKGQIEKALKWQEARKSLIFLRDLLDCSLALDFNFAEAATYTDIGKAERQAKANADAQAVQYLVSRCHSAATKLGLYKECDAVCAVPPSAGKVWDLPEEIAKQVAKKSQKDDISPLVRFRKAKQSVKNLALCDKWGALEAAQLIVSASVKGRRIILIDDKYQSGTTLQFVASKLFAAGASEVLGLSCVKTWRDTDNT
jgi:predicted amidophosphoribosyltransferase